MDIKALYSHLNDLVDANSDAFNLDYRICILIKKSPKEHSDTILGLMYEHHARTCKKKQLMITDLTSSASKKNNTLNVIFKGKTYDTGICPSFNGNNIPIKLQKIIVAYIMGIKE